ncbi:hypothetical protein Taro_045164, partial [Colocasia esculenta]|nr:hypothetical protein [Colocasia esculenta]
TNNKKSVRPSIFGRLRKEEEVSHIPAHSNVYEITIRDTYIVTLARLHPQAQKQIYWSEPQRGYTTRHKLVFISFRVRRQPTFFIGQEANLLVQTPVRFFP